MPDISFKIKLAFVTHWAYNIYLLFNRQFTSDVKLSESAILGLPPPEFQKKSDEVRSIWPKKPVLYEIKITLQIKPTMILIAHVKFFLVKQPDFGNIEWFLIKE